MDIFNSLSNNAKVFQFKFLNNCIYEFKEKNVSAKSLLNLHFIWLDVMMLRWLCRADVMLLLVLFKLMGVGDTSDEACVVMFAFDVFVCSCALEVDVVVVVVVVVLLTVAVIVVSAPVVAAVLFYKQIIG